MSRYLPVLLIGVILLGGHPVSAQVTTATIAGVVQDSSGAVIPGVSVTTRNPETGVTRTAKTDEGGRYTVPELTLGNYEVEAQIPGFQTEVRSGITLTVGRSALVNFALKVGQIADKVTITEEAPLVESTTSAMSSLVDERTIRDLPLNGRSWDNLALLQLWHWSAIQRQRKPGLCQQLPAGWNRYQRSCQRNPGRIGGNQSRRRRGPGIQDQHQRIPRGIWVVLRRSDFGSHAVWHQ